MPTTLSAAVPHSNSKDDQYKDYIIPKGSTMMLNVSLLLLIMISLEMLILVIGVDLEQFSPKLEDESTSV